MKPNFPVEALIFIVFIALFVVAAQNCGPLISSLASAPVIFLFINVLDRALKAERTMHDLSRQVCVLTAATERDRARV